MTTDSKTSSGSGRISADQPDDQFTLEYGSGRDRDVFTARDILNSITAQQAWMVGAGAIQKGHHAMMQGINTWLVNNHESLVRCWITSRDGDLVLLAVSKGGDYNEPLHDSIIDLTMVINQQMGSLPIRVRGLLLPDLGENPEDSFLSSVIRKQIFPFPTATVPSPDPS